MQKNILSIANFIFENNTKCHNDGEGLAIYCDSLRVVISEVDEAPEYIKLSIKEGITSVRPIITQLMPTGEVKNLICGVWNQLEKNTNKEFISQYGVETYQLFRGSFLSALKGEKENDKFLMQLVKTKNTIQVNLKDKTSGMIDCAEFIIKGADSRKNIYGAALMHASATIRIKGRIQSHWSSSGFSIFIPTVEIEDYNLGISVFKKYSKENEFQYLMENVGESSSKNLLTAFQLKGELAENSPSIKNKKNKI